MVNCYLDGLFCLVHVVCKSLHSAAVVVRVVFVMIHTIVLPFALVTLNAMTVVVVIRVI